MKEARLKADIPLFSHRYGKPGCDADTCDYFLSYRRIGTDVEYEMSADTDGWVAVGFSSDKKMVSPPSLLRLCVAFKSERAVARGFAVSPGRR